MIKRILVAFALLCAVPQVGFAQSGPLRIEITDGVIEPMPFAAPVFVSETSGSGSTAKKVTEVIRADLKGTGLFREIPEKAHLSKISSFGNPIAYADWKAVNAQALIVGAVSKTGDRVVVKFRLYDVFSGKEMGKGLQLAGSAKSVRRLAHKVADEIYGRLTGETAYFDSRVVFVSESGPKNARKKRLAIMDYDGANVQYLTDSRDLVLAPRFSPAGDRVLYTSYATGFPRVNILDVGSVTKKSLDEQPGTMSFAPRFSPDGARVVFSLESRGNTDIYVMNVNGSGRKRLTSAPSIETAPSFSPDGSKIVFESDRSGQQQLYIMSASGGDARRISGGSGRYGTPVWSPRGDLIAFTKQHKGRFHIGVMRVDGSEERLLTGAFLDEGPTWAPNGRVIMFTRSSAGNSGASGIYSVDITGRNLKPVPTPNAASDPSWSPLLK